MARFNLGHTLLLENDLERGLPLCEERRIVLHTGAGLRGGAWTGDARPGDTLLVVPEQGLGDFLLMSRFFASLADRFAHVIVQSPAPLARLIATLDPRLEVVTALEGVRFDAWCATMSLPLRLRIDSIDRIPNRPWLRAPAPAAPGEAASSATARGARLRVGLNWAGNPSFAFDRVRSTHLEQLRLLLEVREVEWCSLHKGHLEHEAEAFGLPQPLREASDLLDTAAVVRGLDLVISTETAIPNLSAALGVKTVILAGRDLDWRWRSWYPGVTICQQERSGDWTAPVVQTLELLRQELARAA
jgi:ADP-heptose:LPS heptosyltransferase